MKNNINITIERDYDGYFENWTKELVSHLENNPNNKIKEVVVDSGPYRNAGLSYKTIDNVLHLDFYSAVRRGFGSIGITQEEFAKELCN